MPDSEDYVMISALQHYAYCPRQFALIQIEQVWDENIYKLRGQRVNEKVDLPDNERCDDCSLIDVCMPESIANFTKSSIRNNIFSID